MKRNVIFIFTLLMASMSCSLPFLASPEAIATMTASAQTATAASWTLTPTITLTQTPTLTQTLTQTLTSTITLTPTITWTPSITPTLTVSPTRTFVFPAVVVNTQAHCRYGPSIAYLHAADLYAGDVGKIHNRSTQSRWLLVKFEKLGYYCWVAPSVVDITSGEVESLYYMEPDATLPGPSIYYKAPENVEVDRHKNTIIIRWKQVKMTEDKDRGYFLELFVCQNKQIIWYTYSTPDQYSTSTEEIIDERGCSTPSRGKIYTVEKHGYSTPINITNWPPAP